MVRLAGPPRGHPPLPTQRHPTHGSRMSNGREAAPAPHALSPACNPSLGLNKDGIPRTWAAVSAHGNCQLAPSTAEGAVSVVSW